jgi:hypothetical protein
MWCLVDGNAAGWDLDALIEVVAVDVTVVLPARGVGLAWLGLA